MSPTVCGLGHTGCGLVRSKLMLLGRCNDASPWCAGYGRMCGVFFFVFFFFSSRRRHTRCSRDWSSDVCSSDLEVGFPAIIRPSFTLGGVGGGIAYNIEEFRELAGRGLDLSPVHEILVEESVIGWKEFELEVMRDVADNFVVICSIENIDPMGVHTGDSITVAPALTLTDKEYQRMRDMARRIIRRVGVETGGSNIQ